MLIMSAIEQQSKYSYLFGGRSFIYFSKVASSGISKGNIKINRLHPKTTTGNQFLYTSVCVSEKKNNIASSTLIFIAHPLDTFKHLIRSRFSETQATDLTPHSIPCGLFCHAS